MPALSTAGSRRSAAFQIIFVLMASTLMLLRILAKQVRAREMKHHDFVAFVAYIFLVGYAIAILVATFYGGLGQQTAYILAQPDGPQKLQTFLKAFFASEWCYAISTASARWAIALLYVSVFETRWVRVASYTTAGVVTVAHVGFIVTVLAYCQPIQYSWDRTIPGGHCGDTLSLELASGGINLGLDLFLIFIPLPVIWRLHMPVRKKVIVTALFSIGFVNVGINVGRIVQPLVSDFADFAHSTVDAAILITAELFTALLVACLPTIGPLFNRKWAARGADQPWDTELRRQERRGAAPDGPPTRPVDDLPSRKYFSRLRDEDMAWTGSRSFELHRLGRDLDSYGSSHAFVRASSAHTTDAALAADSIEVRHDLDVSTGPSLHPGV